MFIGTDLVTTAPVYYRGRISRDRAIYCTYGGSGTRRSDLGRDQELGGRMPRQIQGCFHSEIKDSLCARLQSSHRKQVQSLVQESTNVRVDFFPQRRRLTQSATECVSYHVMIIRTRGILLAVASLAFWRFCCVDGCQAVVLYDLRLHLSTAWSLGLFGRTR